MRTEGIVRTQAIPMRAAAGARASATPLPRLLQRLSDAANGERNRDRRIRTCYLQMDMHMPI
jgi:hypothetical protein